ncbi:KaiC domain-containing protein [Haloterrigena alkaliphila]|uniref:KaiC domain-containing protein n=1 Tax=Haloterrigena alkaliphila TaxID=2816475 RepID=A0A8A2VSQ5_9EURY|nr:KaiC domain-containing protein [Haloterrigena alkaliphila]QSX01069.1 KaiC domain-containing protein [Haloterrigena alkaliphila]
MPVSDESDAERDGTEDWFERALADSDDAPTESGDDAAAESRDDAATESEADATPAEPSDAASVADEWEMLEGAADGETSDHDADGEATDSDDEGGAIDEGDGLFDDDFGAALEGADMPSVGDDAGPDGFSDVDFGLEGADEPDFDEAVDSELPRLDLGIDGLDRMIQGGVPERSLIVAMGSAGTGKTTFGLQFLAHGLANGEKAVFITLEESRERVINSATEKGYAFDEYVAEDRLAVVDVDPIEMANSLTSIKNELPTLVEEFDASRLVLDSVSLLEMMYEDRATRRNEIYDFTRSLKEAGVTAVLTSEAAEETPYASRYGIVEYLTDAVFVLQYVRPDDFRETRLAIEIQKIRDANHSREKKPYEITSEGISVYQQANLF